VKSLQFTSIPNFACPSQLFVIIGSKTLKKKFVLRPFVAIHSVNMVAEKSFKLPHCLLPLRILWTDKKGHKNTMVILYFYILESFPFQAARALGPCPSMLSVCPPASFIEPLDWFSWHRNLIYLKVASTPHFQFYFPSISNKKIADT